MITQFADGFHLKGIDFSLSELMLLTMEICMITVVVSVVCVKRNK